MEENKKVVEKTTSVKKVAPKKEEVKKAPAKKVAPKKEEVKKAPSKKAAAKKVSSFPKPTLTDYEIIVKPLLSEEIMRMMEKENKVVVQVKKTANKIAIKNAFQRIFGVKVGNVNTIQVRAVSKTVGRHQGKKSSYKKAIITLLEGNAMDLVKVD